MLIEMNPRGSTTDVRAANTQRVLDVLRASAREWLPVRVISQVSGISRPTVTRVCESLVAAGWASVAEGVFQGVGRPAREYRFRSEHRSVASIVLGPEAARGQLGDLSGDVLSSHYTSGLRLRGPIDAVDAVSALLGSLLSSAGQSAPPAALSVSVPGTVSPDGEIWNGLGAPDWAHSDFVQQLRRRLPGTLLSFANDAHLAAEAELTHGSLRGADSAMYLHPSRSCEIVPIIGGRVYLGANGAAGASAVLQPAQYLEGSLDLMELIFLHEGGDAAATAALVQHIDSSCDRVAEVLAAFDPEVVVLGGMLESTFALLQPRLAPALAQRLRHPPELRLGGLQGQDAPLRGGLDVALAQLDLEHVAAL